MSWSLWPAVPLVEIAVDLVSTDRLTCQLLEQHGFRPMQVHAWAHYDWQQLIAGQAPSALT
jgi:hypothetical protein